MSGPQRHLLIRVGAIVVLTTLAVAASIWQTNRVTLAQARQQLAQVAPVTLDLQRDRLDKLQLRSEALATDPAFIDYVVQSLQPSPLNGGGIDRASISDLLNERGEGYDLLMVLDAKGRPVAKRGVLLKSDASVSGDGLVMRALASGKPERGAWVYDGKLLWIAINPLIRSGVSQGLLLSAQVADSDYIATINRYTGAHTALLVSTQSRGGFALAAGSGLPAWAAPALQHTADALPAGNELPADGRAATVTAGRNEVPGWIVPLSTSSGRALLMAVEPDRDGPSSLVFMLFATAFTALLALAATWRNCRLIVYPLHKVVLDVELAVEGAPFPADAPGGPAMRRLRRAIPELQARAAASRRAAPPVAL